MDNLKGYFKNRDDALEQLIKEIEGIDLNNTLVLSISQDGFPLAKGISRHFGLPLEHLLLSVIRAPQNPDCVIALVSEKMDVVVDERLIDAFEISIDLVFDRAKKQYEQSLTQQAKKIRGENPMQSFEMKDILIVDEGVETGFSIENAIRGCINGGCKSASIATPVISRDVEKYLLERCDSLYRVLSPDYFVSTNYYYKDLPLVEGGVFLDSGRYFF